jgi:hypothetical protein
MSNFASHFETTVINGADAQAAVRICVPARTSCFGYPSLPDSAVLCRPILATVISKSLGLEDRHRSVGKLNHPTHVWSNPGRVDNRSRDPRMSNEQNIFSVHQKTTSVFFHLYSHCRHTTGSSKSASTHRGLTSFGAAYSAIAWQQCTGQLRVSRVCSAPPRLVRRWTGAWSKK